MPKDYYKILGVAKDADEDVIKSAYKKMALKYHPDRHPADKKEVRTRSLFFFFLTPGMP